MCPHRALQTQARTVTVGMSNALSVLQCRRPEHAHTGWAVTLLGQFHTWPEVGRRLLGSTRQMQYAVGFIMGSLLTNLLCWPSNCQRIDKQHQTLVDLLLM